MVIVETPVFTRQVVELLSDDEYAALQAILVARPDAGPLIRGGGGIRKIRWSLPGRGKSGGVRMIYYWAVADEQILMLFAYPKSEQEDLTRAQVKVLRQWVENEFA